MVKEERKLRECNGAQWDQTVRILQRRGEKYAVIQKGSRRKMIVNGKAMRTMVVGGYTSKMSKQAIAFIARFSRELKNKLTSSEELMFLKVNKPVKFHQRSNVLWKKLPLGTIFYGYDIISAYWYCAFLLKYIGKSIYERYRYEEDLKMAKRLCFSWLARNSKCTWFDSDGIISNEIACDNSVYQRVYDNIRYELYNIMAKCCEQIQPDMVLIYNIDAIYVCGAEHKIVANFFKEMNIPVKGTLCRKISASEYTHGTEVRIWKGGRVKS